MDDGRDHDEAWLGALLEAAAEEYEPDAERLRALVQARIARDAGERPAPESAGATRAGPDRGTDAHVGNGAWRGQHPTHLTRPVGRFGRLRRLGVAGVPAGAALAAVGAAAALAVGVTVAVTAHGARPTTVAIVAPSTGSGTGSGSGGPVSQSPSTSGTRPPAGTPGTHASSPGRGASSSTVTPPASVSAVSGSATGSATGSSTGSAAYVAVASVDAVSNPDWAQLDVNLTVRAPLTALEITVTVAASPGLSATGSFDSGASGLFAPSTETGPDGSLTYTFRLNAGQTVAPGGIEFAAQFNHAATGWSASADGYRVSAGPASAAPVVTQGSY